MGNAIAKKFDNVPKDHTATAGHLQLWKIWPGLILILILFYQYYLLGTVKEANAALGTQTGDDVSIWYINIIIILLLLFIIIINIIIIINFGD